MAALGIVPVLTVQMQGGLQFRWRNPGPNVCMSVAICNNLPLANLISWEALPLHRTGNFYETDDCTSRNGSVFAFATALHRDQVDGWHRFQPPRRIRSMMMGGHESALLEEANLHEVKVLHSCDFKKTRAWSEKIVLETNKTSDYSTFTANATDGSRFDNWGEGLLGEAEKEEGTTDNEKMAGEAN